jgi:hypothetical protein
MAKYSYNSINTITQKRVSAIFRRSVPRVFFSLLLVLSLILPVLAEALPYTDIDYKHWAALEAKVLYDKNLMRGVTYDRFAGEQPLNRFQLAEVLDRMLGSRVIPNTTVLIISDVLPDSREYKFINRIVQADLMVMESGLFEGLRPVTRYEFALSMDRLLTYLMATPPLPRDKKVELKDLDRDHEEVVSRLTNTWQLTNGYADGKFRGGNKVTRYEALIMLAKAAGLLYEDVRQALAQPRPTPPIEQLIEASTPPATGVPSGSTSPDNLAVIEQMLNASGKPPASTTPSAVASVVPSARPSARPTPVPTPIPTQRPVPTPKPTVRPQSSPTPLPAKSGDNLSELEQLLNASARPPVPTPKATPTLDMQAIEQMFGSPSPAPTVTVTPQPIITPKPTATPVAIKPTPKPTATPKPRATPKVLSTPKPTATPKAQPSVKPTPSARPSSVPKPTPSALVSASPLPVVTPRPRSSEALSLVEELERQLQSVTASASPSPQPSASLKPAQPDSLVAIPLPSATATPVARPSVSVPVPTELPPPLRSRLLFSGVYKASYDERVPPAIKEGLKMSDTEQTISGNAGAAVHFSSLFWFGAPATPLGNLGLGIDLSSLSGFDYTSNLTPPQKATLTELINADLALLYKVVSTPNFDLALGLDGYYRLTQSSNDPRTHYFLASRSYMGAGLRLQTAWRLADPVFLELSLAPHYVMQDLTNIQLAGLPLQRWDTLINFMLNWDMFSVGQSKVSLNLGYQGLLLFHLGSEASQIYHGVVLGTGYHF